jgi:hypothetical protein
VNSKLGSGMVLSSESSERDPQLSHLYRFETINVTRILVSPLGETCFADVRKRKPRLGKRLVLKRLDTVNVVACLCYVEREAPFAFDTVQDGVDLEYGGGLLRITIRYRQYILRRMLSFLFRPKSVQKGPPPVRLRRSGGGVGTKESITRLFLNTGMIRFPASSVVIDY